MNAEKNIRVGIVGAGANTRAKHIPGLRSIEGVDVVSVANRSRESSERVAREFSIPVVYESWEELVRADDTHAIEVPDHLVVVADMACGAQATFLLSAVTGATPRREAFLYGSEATLRVTGAELYGAPRETGEFSEIPIHAEEAGAWRVEQDFVAAIRGGAPIQLTTFDAGVDYMEFTDAVARGREQERAIAIS